MSLGSLRENIEHLLERLEPPKPLPRTHIDRAITVREKIDRIREIIEKSGQMSFSDALKGSENRTEVIVSFLALLELVKQESIVLKQGGSFDDIMLEKV